MTKNRKIKILMLIIFLIVILLNNFSYANILTKEQLKKSLENILLSEVKIETKTESENGTGSSTMTLGAPEEGENIIVEDSKIRYINEEYNVEVGIDYSIEGKICKFKTTIDINDENINLDEDDAMIKLAMAVAQYSIMQQCYIAVSDAMGVDNSLAYTYYMQQYKDEDVVSNDFYKLTRKKTEDEIEYNMEINMEQLSKLDSSKIDNTSYAKVTINKQGSSEKEEEKKPEETQKPENKEDEKVIVDKNTTNNNQQKVNTNKSVNTDNTIAKTTIPKTGKTMGLCVIISVLIVIAVITYERYKNYKEVK